MRKVGAVWNNDYIVIRNAWRDRSLVLNNISLSGLLIDIPAVFVTLGIKYSLKQAIYEDWKDVKKEFHIQQNKAKTKHE